MQELTLPASVERRNRLDISLGYCGDIDPSTLLSLGPITELRVDGPEELITFLKQDSEEDTVYVAQHLPFQEREWDHVAFARHGNWTLFCSIFSTALAYNPSFADGQRRRLCCGGTRIIGKDCLEAAVHGKFENDSEALLEALRMDLFLSEAMTGKNLSNGFNIGGSKTLVYVGESEGPHRVAEEDVHEFSRFMACFHNSMTQGLPVFIGTGSDLNFHEHGEAYYDLCSRISPNYTGNQKSGRRWGRVTSGNTTEPTAAGVLACLEAVREALGIEGDERTILVKGLGGIGLAVVKHHLELGWKVYATEIRPERVSQLRAELGDRVEHVAEKDWASIPQVSLFSPNAAAASLTRENVPVLHGLGVKAVVGGENNIREKGLDADVIFREFGILTFADFLLNGGGAWIVDAEMVGRPVGEVQDWIRSYQVPTVLATIEHARAENRSPESIFVEFIGRKVQELLI